MSREPAHPAQDAFDGGRRAALARTFAAMGGLTWLPAIAEVEADAPLLAPVRHGGMALTETLAARRSVRRFGTQPLALAAASQLLWAAQGLSAAGRRTAPSAGALYPLELHLVAARVDGLGSGAYRYLPEAHALRRSGAQITLATLQAAALGQSAVGQAPAAVVIAAIETRSAGKYGARAARYAAFEAGAAAQNLALQAVALGLGSVVIGGFDDDAVAGALQLPVGERPLVLVPVGALP